MFIHQERLRHLLQPLHYFDADHFRVELEGLFRPSWQFVTTHSEIAGAGDYVTFDLLGTPIMVRNFGDQVKAFQNVCPHRHSMLSCQSHGNQPTLRCQYHGWEFDQDGRTGKIPEAKAFRPWDRENAHLKPIRLERCGDLYFATTDEDLPSLSDWLGEHFATLQNAFSTPLWKMRRRWDFDAPCNWKVPTENTLESYHVGAVHPAWMGGDLPPEAKSQHKLEDAYTSLEYQEGSFAEKQQARLNRELGGTPTNNYRHLHVHPNMTFCLSDTFNYLAVCDPVSPTTSRVRTRMYPVHGKSANPWNLALRSYSWHYGRRIMVKIFNEDRSIYAAQQKGLEASDRPGVIGNREERVYQFQLYVCKRLGLECDFGDREDQQA